MTAPAAELTPADRHERLNQIGAAPDHKSAMTYYEQWWWCPARSKEALRDPGDFVNLG